MSPSARSAASRADVATGGSATGGSAAVGSVLATIVLVCGALTVASVAGCARTPVRRVSIWGDSLTASARPLLTAYGARVYAFPGTAPCDWMSRFGSALDAERPTVVVLAFVGNDSSRCMRGARTGLEVSARYRADLTYLVSVAARHHARVVLVVPPLMSPGRSARFATLGSPDIVTIEAALARRWPAKVTMDDTARHLLSPRGVYTRTLDGGPIRQPDGVHLTPAGARLYAMGLTSAAGAARRS